MTFRGRPIVPRAAGCRKLLRLVARCVGVFDCLLWEPFEVGCNTRALLGPILYVKNKLVNGLNRKMKLYTVK